MRTKLYIFIALFLFTASIIFCTGNKLSRTAPKHDGAPKIDGILDEDIWKQSLVIDNFTQRFPKEGNSPTEKTVVHIFYTPTSLYIGVQAFDSQPDKIFASAMRRDDFSITENDQFVIAIDSYNDGRNGYWFSTNPLGVKVDAQFFDEGEIWESNWDGIWNCEAVIHESGWSAELEIPFSTLRFNNGDDVTMGINLFRRIIRTNEQIFSPLIPLSVPYGTPRVSFANKFVFSGIDKSRSLKFEPYVLGKYVSEKNSETDKDGDVGFDLRYNITDNFVTNFSYNIDFAQAEVDDQQINLTRFNLFYPEKRDFFLENSGIFSVGMPQENEIFFSRKIGLKETSPNNFEPIPIQLGLKATGKVSDLNIGVMNLQTRSAGEIPSQNFSVARIKYELQNSYLSAITTNVVDKNNFANTSAVDFSANVFGDAKFYGFAALTSSRNNKTNIGNGSSVFLDLYQLGERTSFALNYMYIGKNYKPELGFVNWQGVNRYNATLTVPFYIETETLRRIIPRFYSLNIFNLDGKREYLEQTFEFGFEFQSEDVIKFWAAQYFEHVPFDYSIFKSHLLHKGEYNHFRYGLSIDSKPGRIFSGGLSLSLGELYGGSMYKINPSINWKINKNLTVTQFYSANFVELQNEKFTTQLFRTVFNYSFNTHLSLSGSVQYNNSNESILLNLRTSYIPSDGIALYLIINSTTENSDIFRKSNLTEETTKMVLLKFNYLFKI
ncbi:MAG: carbohydrate binding family 9 domain-containing protein [Ignavibacteriales bacterium]|nr:carbohydrate binding family 9 domain-containing protein [Ignavibacteriales bacterium]